MSPACHVGARKAQPQPQPIHLYRGGPLVALVGTPNCGKTALFNALTGSRQKVANYAGVTVERKEGLFVAADGRKVRMLDLPGIYSLNPRSPDERVAVEVLRGQARGERRPDRVICVVDATNLRRNLRLVLAVKRLGIPCVVALNMMDLAERRGIVIDAPRLAAELGVPVVPTVAVRKGGTEALRAWLQAPADAWGAVAAPQPETSATLEADHDAVQRILSSLGLDRHLPPTRSDRIDRVVLHPVWGLALLAVVLFLMFQAVFAWAEAPMEWIESATAWLGEAVADALPAGWLTSLLVEGVIAGVGAVLVFLPQILILFFFILVLEESGYLPRAAFLLDRFMAGVGLSGRSFIPLLSSFACAVPGIMATRTIANPRDRLLTIMIAPLMTCSARLPVYALLIGAFIPERKVAGLFDLRGLVLFGLYLAGIVSAMAVAWLVKLVTDRNLPRPLMMELPAYHWPAPRNIVIGLWQRAEIFLKRVGGVILALTVLMWFLASFPAPPPGSSAPAIETSLAGTLGRLLAVVLEPIGFNWQISIALVPSMAAREVAISALATVYALSASGDDTAQALTPLIAESWSLATGLSLLTWFIFAPQCLSTLAAVRRETGSWTWVGAMALYLFGLAWLACYAVYHLAVALGWG